MRNFEFKNPILKFKEGRKIGKYKNPAGPIYSMIKPGHWMARTPIIGEDGLQTFTNSYVNPEKIVPLKDGRTIAKIKGKWYDLNGLLITKFVSHNSPATPTETSTETSVADLPINTGTDGTGGKGTVKRQKFVSRLGELNLNGDEKAILAQHGVTDFSDAMQIQNAMLALSPNINLGARKGAGIADGYFGDKSLEAFNALRNYGVFKPKTEPVIDAEEPIKPVSEVPVDAPDFGYRTSNTYEGNDFMNKVKGMGIKSNADLINFMYNSGKAGWKGDAWQTQFRSDVDRALGGDYSDANIRKVFGTQGKWGRGFMGRGDFGDFQNVLQTNAGTWNGNYDRRLNDARMEISRQQLAAKMAQRYAAPQLSKPLDNRFSIGNNISVNTLGDAGATLGADIDKLKGDPIYGRYVN